MPDLPPAPVRTVFAPSPIGRPSLGLVRMAVYNWALARHHGGTFVLRVEDTDEARVRPEFYEPLLDVLRWLGLDWDEGPGTGGAHGPYLQTERRELHLDVARRLLAAGELYESFSTPEEVAGRRTRAGQDPRLGYDNADRHTSEREKAAHRAAGRRPSLRLRLPDGETVFDDLARGEIVFKAGSAADPVLVRANGRPTFALAGPVDDALMGITHNIRGDAMLPLVPRQLAAYRALERIGVARAVPRLGHVPMVLASNAKILNSQQDPAADALGYRDAGVQARTVVNYLAALGWSHPTRGGVFTPAELVADFDVRRVRTRPGRLDVKRLTDLDTTHLRELTAGELTEALVPHLAPLDGNRLALLTRAAPALRRRAKSLPEAARAAAALFDDEPAAIQEPDFGALQAARDALAALSPWTEETLSALLKGGLAKASVTAVRTAVTGPAHGHLLLDFLVLLGPERGLRRIDGALARSTAQWHRDRVA
ncbi:glutamate--tRNA ligase [Amycolatopsis sp. FBCC-B4732]|uniref:glutamate--tRNA ligase n=1 Tax=Amycolatopsis sp. FBCC-B4732 TaxID=3079339 RepID=UPI001FF13277|nr:glutamate--tRNA ligase family protein [Amycolatopsis sp. FBCC-B4732]UOX92991.1 glutamate--tRNA ligase [Amycolatopsis sp. FBCC-B4732]